MSEWEPATDAEVAMRDALRTDDQESYFRILSGVDLLLPVSADALAGLAPLGWGTWSTGGRTHVLAFTSSAALQACLADYSGSARRVPYAELANTWPNLEWWLAVNPGLPIEGYLPAWFVAQLSRGDLRLPTRGPGRDTSPASSKIQDRQPAGAATARREEGTGQPGGPTHESAAVAAAPAGYPQYPNYSGTAPVGQPEQGRQEGGQQGGQAGFEQPRPTGSRPDQVGPGGLPIRTPGGVLPSGLPARSPTPTAPTSAGSAAVPMSGNGAQIPAGSQSAGPDGGNVAGIPAGGGAATVPSAYRPPTVPGSGAEQVAPTSGAAWRGQGPDPRGTVQHPRVFDLNPPAAAQDSGAPGPDAYVSGPDPQASEPDPRAAAQDPRAATQDPRAATQDPRAAAQDPRAAAQDPRAAAHDPRGAADERAAADDSRGAADDPRAAAQDPRAAAQDLRAATQDPRAATQGLRAAGRDPGAAGPGYGAAAQDARPAGPDPRATGPDARGFGPHGAAPDPRLVQPDPRGPLPVRTPMAQTPPVPERIAPHDPAELPADPSWSAAAAPAAPTDLPRRQSTPSTAQGFPQGPASPQAQGQAQPQRQQAAAPPSPQQSMQQASPSQGFGSPLPRRQGSSSSDQSAMTSFPGFQSSQPAAQADVPPSAVRPPIIPGAPGTDRPARLTAQFEARGPAATPPAPRPRDEAFVPANDVERDLYQAAGGGSTDAFLSTLLLATVLVPVAHHSRPGSAPGESGFVFRTEASGNEQFLVVFTSRDRLAEHFAEPTRTVSVRFLDLIRNWPDPAWSFSVNPGGPIGARYPGPQVIALANWATEAGLGAEPADGPLADDLAEPVPAPEPARDDAQQATVMQKTLPPEQVDYYLERGYDRVAGFVHRATEVEHLRTPGELFSALGLGYDSSSHQPDAKEAYVLRWPAYRPSLYRIPYGGQNEQALRAMDGWVLERAPFRGNGFAPGEGRDVIAEFKVDSVRLPHGAQLWRVDADGSERMIAIFDNDGPLWRRVGER